MARMVALGGSFDGLTAVIDLNRLVGKKAFISVASSDEKHVFVPSAPWQSKGWRKTAAMSSHLKPVLVHRGISFVRQEPKDADSEQSKALTDSGEILPDDDYLIVSTGPFLFLGEGPGPASQEAQGTCIHAQYNSRSRNR